MTRAGLSEAAFQQVAEQFGAIIGHSGSHVTCRPGSHRVLCITPPPSLTTAPVATALATREAVMLLVLEERALGAGGSSTVGEVSIVQPDGSSCCYTALNPNSIHLLSALHGKRYRCVWSGIRRSARIGE